MVPASEDRVIRFPDERVSHPVREGATWIDIARGRFKELIGRTANRIRIPGAVQSAEIHDNATGQHIEVVVGTLFTRLTVNGRDFYFNRFTGRFNGTGSSSI